MNFRYWNLVLIIMNYGIATAAEQTTETAVKKPVVGYGYATSVLPAKNQEKFLSGFELGYKSILGEDSFRNMVTVDRDNSGSASGSLQVLDRLIKKDVKFIVGFPTSHEALQVSDRVQNESILTIFPAAGHSRLATMGRTIFTTGESMKGNVEQTTSFLMKTFQKKKGLLVYNPAALFSVNQRDEFENYFRKLTEAKPNLKFAALDRDLRLSPDYLKELSQGVYEYIFVTMYADESFPMIGQQFVENKIDLPILANSSWNTGDIDFIRRAISQKKAPIITTAIWLAGSSESRNFERIVKKVYGTKPTTDLSTGFDVGIIAATVIKRAHGDFSRENLLKVFHQNRCFEGTSTGRMCFPETGGHSDVKLHFKYLTKRGLAELE